MFCEIDRNPRPIAVPFRLKVRPSGSKGEAIAARLNAGADYTTYDRDLSHRGHRPPAKIPVRPEL